MWTSVRGGGLRGAPNPDATRLPRPVAAHPHLAGAAVALLILLAGGFLALRDSALVRVERVSVSVATGPEGPQVRAALEQTAREMTTLHVRRDALMSAVARYPTVRGLEIHRDLLHGLRITVVRRPGPPPRPADHRGATAGRRRADDRRPAPGRRRRRHAPARRPGARGRPGGEGRGTARGHQAQRPACRQGARPRRRRPRGDARARRPRLPRPPGPGGRSAPRAR